MVMWKWVFLARKYSVDARGKIRLHPSGDRATSSARRMVISAISSGVERMLHTHDVAGSNPASRTILSLSLRPVVDSFWKI